jgi:hypothetical protein
MIDKITTGILAKLRAELSMIRHTVFVRMPDDGFALETSICPGVMWRLLAI